MKGSAAQRWFGAVLILCSGVGACGEPTAPRPLAACEVTAPSGFRARLAAVHVVALNPYDHVDWSETKRWLVQLHDHLGTRPAMYQAYDLAGYDAVPVMDYSGVLSLDYAWHERHWPAESWLPADVISAFTSIRLLFPGAEEVGDLHLTSPFLTTYIEKWESTGGEPQPWQYVNTQGGIDAINRFAGFAFVAHPWYDDSRYRDLQGFAGMEIFSAYEAFHREQGDPFFVEKERGEMMLQRWDEALMQNPTIVGIAVNDHFGPGSTDSTLSPRVRDSGKVIVLADTLSLDELREALARGRVLAVKDFGATKGEYPRIDSIWTDSLAVNVKADGEVVWISDGRAVCKGPRLLLASLPVRTHYVRAEVRGADGSTIYLQALAIK